MNLDNELKKTSIKNPVQKIADLRPEFTQLKIINSPFLLLLFLLIFLGFTALLLSGLPHSPAYG
jgi:hypothetical protein